MKLLSRFAELSATASGLAGDVRRLADDEALRLRLGSGAAKHSEATFDSAAVVERIESLYSSVLSSRKNANR